MAQISVSAICNSSSINQGCGSAPIVRRTANPHPNVWGFDVIHSLKSAYGEHCYRERAEKLIGEIKCMFNAINNGDGDDGNSTPSAYDTAWVARVPAIDGSARPQFPQTLEWILQNQLEDGSWGTQSHFLLSDRLLSTLACVITLRKWNTGHLHLHRGLQFIRDNLHLITKESQDNMVTDFEIIFPSLLKEAKSLELSLPYYSICVEQLSRTRENRLARLSENGFRSVPSSMLCSLEGLLDVIDFKRIGDVQSPNGSFLNSPASTAYVFMHTGDENCLSFLNNLVAKFGSYVPCLYPVDLLERLLAVDTVERLGIDRHFELEIKQALDYVHRYWNERGIGCGKDNSLPDLEITALGFRLLRLHRYNVSPVVFENFKDERGQFVCPPGQANREITSMLSLYRASELAFPGENVMDEARIFTTKYLRGALPNISDWNRNQCLGQEIKYALENPWQKTVSRYEAKRYCQIYQPDYHVLLRKNIYKMPRVYNDKYLELAKLDFNIVHSDLLEEMKNVTRWFKDSGLPQFTFARERPLEFFFLIAAGTFEPQYAACRLAFTKVACLQTVLDDMYDTYGTLDELKLFTEAVRRWDLSFVETLPDYMKLCYKVFYDIVHEVAWESEKAQGRELLGFFREAWEDYLGGYMEEAEWLAAEHVPTLEEYIRNGITSIGQRVLLLSGVFLMGQLLPENILQQVDLPGHPDKLIELNCIISRLSDDTKTFQAEKARGELASSIECYMKDHRGSTEEEALNHLYAILDPAIKELTRQFLNPHDNVPLPCKKMLFDETRVTMVIFRDGDGFGVSKKEVKDYIKETLIQPLPM
eukprot:Gb_39995 [translate_table: standard]